MPFPIERFATANSSESCVRLAYRVSDRLMPTTTMAKSAPRPTMTPYPAPWESGMGTCEALDIFAAAVGGRNKAFQALAGTEGREGGREGDNNQVLGGWSLGSTGTLRFNVFRRRALDLARRSALWHRRKSCPIWELAECAMHPCCTYVASKHLYVRAQSELERRRRDQS